MDHSSLYMFVQDETSPCDISQLPRGLITTLVATWWPGETWHPPTTAAELVSCVVGEAAVQRGRFRPRDVLQCAGVTCATHVPAAGTQVAPSLDMAAPRPAARLHPLVVRQTLGAAICTARCVVCNNGPDSTFDPEVLRLCAWSYLWIQGVFH